MLSEINDQIWGRIYKLPFQVTKESKLQWFQYRINQYILTTNSYLYRAGIVDSPFCTRCITELETIEHALWECDIVQSFLRDFCSMLDSLYIPFAFNKELFIFGLYDNQYGVYNIIDNFILILIKHYIYKTRCLLQPLSSIGMKKIILNNYNVLKSIAVNKDTNYFKNFQNQWNKWKSLIEVNE